MILLASSTSDRERREMVETVSEDRFVEIFEDYVRFYQRNSSAYPVRNPVSECFFSKRVQGGRRQKVHAIDQRLEQSETVRFEKIERGVTDCG